ncbi:hypothetical protein H9Q10_09540 [Eikenella sp. S3360]|uniref:Uncharacterized protein n=1 Tax=Eikenella glucosivorans TaxID=2766967 RepID=A0ABS0NCB9_9NEIS|nr:hypothetical protein [Eikenella glucosivorans]MBH5329907.1 hypothetical protein [Eikenella glucosivorans]
MMSFEIAPEYVALIVQAVRDAESFAAKLNIDLSRCRVEIHKNVPCRETVCDLVHFYEEVPAADWLEVSGLKDVCVYIARESRQTVLITQSR